MFHGTFPDRTLAWVLVLLLAFPVAIPFFGVTEAGPSGRVLDKGDWTVVGNETTKDQTVRLTGNLTIGTGAKLTITNSTLELNMSKDHGFHITVKDGGRFVLVDSVVRSMAPGQRYKLNMTNASIESDRSYIENFTSISIDRSKAVLNNTTLMDNNGTVLAITGSGVTMAGCLITMRNVGDAVRLSDSTLDIRYSTFQTLRDSINTGINITGGSTVTFQNGGIYNFSTGIEFQGSSMDLENLRITGSQENGIQQLAGTSQITSSIFDENLQSIEVLGGSTTITLSDIRGRGFGIALEDCTAHVGHNTVRSSAEGMFVVNSSAYITDNTIKDNTIGLKMLSSKNGTIDGNVFENNSQAILFEISTMTVTDCQFSSSSTDLQLTASTVTTVNSTFKKEILDPQSTLIVEWYLDVKVETFNMAPAPGASVTMHDSLGAHIDRTTATNGWARNIILRQRTTSRYGTTYNTPYAIEAHYKSAQGSMTLTINMSEAITITVHDLDLSIKDLSVSNLTTNVNKPIFINVTVDSTVYPIKGVSLRVLEDGNVYSNDRTFDMAAEVVVPLELIPSKPGTHNITIYLDPTHMFNETDRINNIRNLTIAAVGGAADLPDLRPIGITPDTTSFQEGSPISVTVDVENAGTVDAANVVVQLFADGKQVGENKITTIYAGSMNPTVFSWSASTGQHTLKVVVDPYDSIKESDESNNELSTPVDISSSNPSSVLNDAVALMCISMLVIIVIVIVVIIYAMVRRSKPSSYQQYQYPYGQQYTYQPQYAYPPGATYATNQATSYSNAPQPMAQITPSSNQAPPTMQTTGKIQCPRCRSTKIRIFDDGHKQCEDCRKIFF